MLLRACLVKGGSSCTFRPMSRTERTSSFLRSFSLPLTGVPGPARTSSAFRFFLGSFALAGLLAEPERCCGGCCFGLLELAEGILALPLFGLAAP